MHASFRHLDHRPWPLPAGRWMWRQTWKQLAFIHYRIETPALRALIPDELEIQEFGGSAWIGVVPFLMADVSVRELPSIAPMRRFPELNVRTYVQKDGRPGVWFFSLDADCWPIVLGGRMLYGLPYHKAQMAHVSENNAIRFESTRRDAGTRFRTSFRPLGDVFYASAGSFEHWAAERYCLYSEDHRGLLSVDVHHQPWPLQKASVVVHENALFEAAGIVLQNQEPVCHFSTGVEVVSFSPQRPDLQGSLPGYAKRRFASMPLIRHSIR
jgi:uncharacterized protein YqjF (DUF2071 family)